MKKVLEMLTIQEAATMEGISRATIYNWIDAGVLGYVKKGSIRLLAPDAVKAASQIMEARRNGGRLRGRKKVEKK